MDTITNETLSYAGSEDDIFNTTNCIITSLINSTLQNVTGCYDNDTGSDVISNAKPIPRAHSCNVGPGYVRWVGDIAILPPVVIVGVIGNILSFIVFCLQKSNMTTTILLCFLAAIDTLILLAAIPLRFLRQMQVCYDTLDGYNEIYTYYIFYYGYPWIFILRTAGTWTTTLLAVDRHIGICRPFHSQRLVTIKLAVYQIVGVTIGSIIFSLPTFFEFHFVPYKGHMMIDYRDFAKTKAFIFGYKIITAYLVMYIIPITIMVVFNWKLVRYLRKAAKDRELLQRSVSSESLRLNRSITIVVVVVVVTFMICNIAPIVSHTIFSLEKLSDELGEQLDTPRRYATHFSNLFVTINSSVNFLIYSVCCRSFRMTFIQRLCCWFIKKKPRQRINGRASSGSANTFVSSLLENGGHHNKSIKMENHGEKQEKSNLIGHHDSHQL